MNELKERLEYLHRNHYNNCEQSDEWFDEDAKTNCMHKSREYEIGYTEAIRDALDWLDYLENK